MKRHQLASARWRFRTAALVGPWRPTAGQAAADAVAKGQAMRDESEPHGIRWRVAGSIQRERGDDN